MGRESEALSTSAQISPAWKNEVNRRLAEHRCRKGSPDLEPKAALEAQPNASRRAVEAAARVAARYANAPSYSEMLAAEARTALRAAEAVSRAALHAQAAAQSVLDGIEAAHAPRAATPRTAMKPDLNPVPGSALQAAGEPGAESRSAPAQLSGAFSLTDGFFSGQSDRASGGRHEPGPAADEDLRLELADPEASAAPAAFTAALSQPVSVRWDAELPLRPAGPPETRASRGQDVFSTGAEDWWRPAAAEPEQREPGPIEAAEPELVEPQPIPGNLIEFPREHAGSRKSRARVAESPQPAAGMQLSIFEVDPVSLPAEPAVEAAPETAPAWTAPARQEMEPEMRPRQQAYENLTVPAPQAASGVPLEPASAMRQLLAIVTDGALIAGSLLAAAVMAASRARALPGPRATEMGMAAAFLVAAALYQTLFLALGRATPGMKYAHIRLTTFEGRIPARAERYRRLAALPVSVLPAGLGFAWSLFDDDRMSWHDRLSRTYLCKR